MTTDATAAFQLIEIGRVHESSLNHRKIFDPSKLDELAQSIRAKGVLTPLLVRPNAKGVEIAAGHRRYRAAKLAGVTELPCVVREMSDSDFLEVLVIENDQREDVHPLEEAEGYRSLMTKASYSVEKIAERVGRSEKYVYDRVKLLQLTKPAQKLFLDGKITAGHAILLARLKPKDQERAIDPEARAVFEHEHVLEDPDDDSGPITTEDAKRPRAGRVDRRARAL